MKPSIPKGTRDFSPSEMVKRNYIFDTIRSVFKLYGYLPIETPSMENLDTLMGKYGEEGDRLIFKILNSGNPFTEIEEEDVKTLKNEIDKRVKARISKPEYEKLSLDEWKKIASDSLRSVANKLTEKTLRYDLTVPFARYVVMHQNEITFPFKRYQIQSVWRADRPQKGRYREFYQCDADVIGSGSLLNEVELVQIVNDVFTKLKVPIIIKLNNRKVLQAIAEIIGAPDRMIDIAVAIDKLDKIGPEGVHKELIDKKFTYEQATRCNQILQDLKVVFKGDFKKHDIQTHKVVDLLQSNLFNEGSKDLLFILNSYKEIGKGENIDIEVDFSLARGLNYYTGTIIEIKVDTNKCKSQFTSSIGGGGRYDDLTGIFGLPNVSGVGISFGADRIYDVLEELGRFPADVTSSTKVMFVNFGENEAKHCLGLVSALRQAGISAELYPNAAKFKKQMSYADAKKIAYVVFVGMDEISKGIVKLKNMASGEEKEIQSEQLVKHLTNI